MFSFSFTVEVSLYDKVPTPTKILNELDSISLCFGMSRKTDERTRHYSTRLLSANRRMITDKNPGFVLGGILGVPPRSLICELDGEAVVKFEIDQSRNLLITAWERVSPSLTTNTKTEFSHDLLSDELIFLDELIHQINSSALPLKLSIDDRTRAVRDDLKLYHLHPYSNVLDETFVLSQTARTVYKVRRGINPDSVKIQIQDKTFSYSEVFDLGDLVEGTYHLDPWEGLLTIFWSKSPVFVSYQWHPSRWSCSITPGVAHLPIHSKEVHDRWSLRNQMAPLSDWTVTREWNDSVWKGRWK